MIFPHNPMKLLLRQNAKSICIRFCSTEQSHRHDGTQNVADEPVRVRFAPSPTGNSP